MRVVEAWVNLVGAILLIGKLEHLHHIHILIAHQSRITVKDIILSCQFINICGMHHTVHITHMLAIILRSVTFMALLVLLLLFLVLFVFFMTL